MKTQKMLQPVVLACSHVSKNFEELHLLKDVDFTVRKGEKVGLVGPNGSGKSTLLKIIAGILEKDGGMVTHAKDAEIRYFPQVHMEQGNMSGGEIAKRVLAPIVSSDANLFLLDEPTNNLDIDGLLMVEHFVLKSNKTFLIVSHDREFLDKTVDKIIEIDSVTQSSFVYDGNYSEYIKERTERIERQWKEFEAKTERAEKLENSVDQRLTWMKEIEKTRRGIKNLPMHEKEKPVAAVLRDKEAKAGKRARIMKDRLEKFKESTEEIVRPKRVLPLQVVFDNERGGTKVFDLAGVEKRIGKRHIGPIDLHIQYGDRIHIVGKNGAGKTTLIKMLVGEAKPDKGILEKGENVKIGYISQERWASDSHKTVIEEFLEATELPQTMARKILNRFSLTTEDVKKDVSILSPGEYSRLVIAKLVAIQPNCIILDEPSNHLDLQALEELEDGLKEYKGTLIVVSHDRYFIEKLKCNREFAI